MVADLDDSSPQRDVRYFPAVGAAVVTFYWLMVVYFWTSVPIHVRAPIHQPNDFVLAFPRWYSLVMLPWLGLQLYFFLTIKVTVRQQFLYRLGAER